MLNQSSSTEVQYKSLAFMGFPKYRVGDDGSIWKYAAYYSRWRKLKPIVRPTGHCQVQLYNSGSYKWFFLHRIVLTAFVGECPEGMQCCHYPDRDPQNNRLENLMWGTVAENCSHKHEHGTSNIGKKYNQGEQHPRCRLTDEQVREIRRRAVEKRSTQKAMAKEFGVTYTYLNRVVLGYYRKDA